MPMNIKREKLPKLLTMVFFAIAIFVSVGVYVNFLHQKSRVKAERYNDIFVVAELKANQIEMWRRERLNDAQDVMNEYIDRPHKVKQLKYGELLSSERSILSEGSGYKNIFIVDLNFNARNVADNSKKPLGADAVALVKEAMGQKKIIFGDFSRDEKSGEINIDISAPIILPGARAASGAIVLRIDPYKYLYPLIQSNPMRKKTFETSLVKKEGDHVLYLNELKFSKEPPLKLSFLLDKDIHPSVLAAKNIEGQVEGKDYRGVPVIAVIRKIVGSDWSLITKIDKDEIYSEVRAGAVLVYFIILIFAFASGGVVIGTIWYRQNAAFYKELYKVAAERKAAADNYKYLIHFASDIILLFNRDLKIVDANNMAILSYGYSQEELMQMSIKDLTAEDGLGSLQKELEETDKKGNYIFSTVHKRKDGSTFPVEVSCGVTVVEWHNFYQCIVRDISARKT